MTCDNVHKGTWQKLPLAQMGLMAAMSLAPLLCLQACAVDTQLESEPAEAVAEALTAASGTEAVVILPGALGSELYALHGEHVHRAWPPSLRIGNHDLDLLTLSTNGDSNFYVRTSRDYGVLANFAIDYTNDVPIGKPVDLYQDFLASMRNAIASRTPIPVTTFWFDWRQEPNLLADQLYAFAKEKNFARVTLLGMSYGGVVGAAFAKKHPEMVSKYITVGTPFGGSAAIIKPMIGQGLFTGLPGLVLGDGHGMLKPIAVNSPSSWVMIPRQFAAGQNTTYREIWPTLAPTPDPPSSAFYGYFESASTSGAWVAKQDWYNAGLKQRGDAFWSDLNLPAVVRTVPSYHIFGDGNLTKEALRVMGIGVLNTTYPFVETYHGDDTVTNISATYGTQLIRASNVYRVVSAGLLKTQSVHHGDLLNNRDVQDKVISIINGAPEAPIPNVTRIVDPNSVAY